jgi:hypothetical protein
MACWAEEEREEKSSLRPQDGRILIPMSIHTKSINSYTEITYQIIQEVNHSGSKGLPVKATNMG